MRIFRRLLWVTLTVVVVLAVAFFVGGGWYFSGQIDRDLLDASDKATTYELQVEPVAPSAVRIEGNEPDPLPNVLTTDAVYGARSPKGERIVVTAVLEVGDAWVVRRVAADDGEEFWAGDGTQVPAVSQSRSSVEGEADLYREVWETPQDIGLSYRDVVVDAPDGPLPAWEVPALAHGGGAAGDTWAVMVHGKGGTRAEPLRSLITVAHFGMDALLVTYRNDTGVFTSDGEQYAYGVTEWRDLEASVQYALDQGASDVVLFGYSLGGAVTAAFLENSPLTANVVAVVLDSPMLDVKQTVYHGADQRTLPVVGLPIPDALTWSALQISRLRFGSDWYDADYLDDTSWVTQPTLVFQGTDDGTVPPTTSEQLAGAEPELVTLVLTPGADHVASWNTDPSRYDAALRDFLTASVPAR
jgi:uncharacterized protein